MSFERPWLLFMTILPLHWILFEWRRGAHRVGALLKGLAIAAVLIALAEPRLGVPENKVAAILLVDTSASVSADDLERASKFVGTVERRRGRNWTRVIPFARAVRQTAPGESGKSWSLKQTAGEAGRGTDIEAALREAVAALPTGMVPRVVLMSDGNENHGSIARASWLAQELHVPIDTVPMVGRARPNLRVESVTLPSVA